MRSIFIFVIIFVLLTGCSKIAVMSTPKKQPIPSHSQLAQQAQQQFWVTLHSGDYNAIPRVEKLLTAAYIENPHDPSLAAHLGFLHIWRLAERARLSQLDPLIVN